MSKVHFIHRRLVVDGRIHNSGGYTVAFKEENGGIVYATAKCSPRDNFSRHMGRVKAQGRLNSPKHATFIATSFDEFKRVIHEATI